MLRVAFRMLLDDRARYLALILGVAFATLLISQQSAIFWSVLTFTTQPIRQASAADIWVMKPGVEYLDLADPLSEGTVNRVRSVPGVAWAVPYYQSTGVVRTRAGDIKPVLIIGVDEVSLLGLPAGSMVLGRPDDLGQPDGVILDVVGYGKLFPGQPPRLGDELEVGQVRARVVGLCRAAPVWSGSALLYARRPHAVAMARETVNPVSFVLAGVRPGEDPARVARAITARTGRAAWTRQEFRAGTVSWFLRESGVAENFGVTILLGVVVGVAVVGQTFYTFAVENQRPFAALKAIGVTNRTLLGMLAFQALLVAALGYGLGMGASCAFFAAFSEGSSGLRGVFMPVEVFLGTACFVAPVTLLAALLGAYRVLCLDPALVFRG